MLGTVSRILGYQLLFIFEGLIATVKCTDQLHARDRFSVILGYQWHFIFEDPIVTVKCTDQLHARDRFSGILGYQLLFIFEGPIKCYCKMYWSTAC